MIFPLEMNKRTQPSKGL